MNVRRELLKLHQERYFCMEILYFANYVEPCVEFSDYHLHLRLYLHFERLIYYLQIRNRINEKSERNVSVIMTYLTVNIGTAVAQWLRCCATKRKVTGSIPDGVIGIFH